MDDVAEPWQSHRANHGTQAEADTVSVPERIRAAGVLPVVEMPDPALAVPLADALRSAGLAALEITYRTDGASEAIAAVRTAYPDMLVGAGTVLTIAQLVSALDSGAQFVVSPGFSPTVVERALASGTTVLPGICTPTEVQMGLHFGLKTFKFFPAEPAGGVAYLRALADPYQDVEFVPTGGIGAKNLCAYLALANVAACGGSWFVKKEWLARGDFEAVTQHAAAALDIVRDVRG